MPSNGGGVEWTRNFKLTESRGKIFCVCARLRLCSRRCAAAEFEGMVPALAVIQQSWSCGPSVGSTQIYSERWNNFEDKDTHS